MTQVKFKEHTSAQASINYYTDGTVALQSYQTIVVEVRENWIKVNGLYSATTRKHIGWFAKMFNLTYRDLKQLYEDSKIYNMSTGEYKDAQ